MRGILTAIVLTMSASAAGAAEPYRDTAHKFALDVPDGWQVMLPRDLAEFNAAASRRSRDPSIAGFRPVGTVGIPVRGKHPLVVVSAIANPKAELSFAEFEKSITEVFTEDHTFGYRVLRTPLAFDEPRRRATMQCHDDAIGIYAVAFLGKDEMILIGCLCERRSYETHLPTFKALAESFRFEGPDAVPVAPPPPPSLLDKTFGSIGPTGRTAIMGGAVAVVVLALGAVLMRGGDAPERRRRRDYY